jgi:two-component system osmolarity sensor histidine kinase EnvZ
MAAPTLHRRLLVAQAAGSLALLLVFGAAFYVERNRTVARLTAQRWAPALRVAAGLGDVPNLRPDASAVRVLRARPPEALATNAWAPRVAMLRQTLREDGVPAGEVVFTRGEPAPVTWVEVAVPGGTRWLGFDDQVIESHVVRRTLLMLAVGFAVVAAASAWAARRLTRPLEALRRRIEAQQAPHLGHAGPASAPAGGAATLEIAAIEAAWVALGERLERQESERALLLAGVSHDLRSPLARIRMAAELLPESPDVAPRRASIVRNVDVADRLIASFLEYVRAAELPLEATVDLAAVARRLLAARDEPPHVLALAAPERLDVPRTHELLLERLLANLVDNAMRHGQPPVLVRLALLPAAPPAGAALGRSGASPPSPSGAPSAARGVVILEVEDHGPGIAPEAQARLTQAFARGDASRGRPGTGLGLAIVQQIVRRMGGTLAFERVAGAPCVRVRLPA